MINGIPCQIKTPDTDGNITQVETCYFATFRKCPELAEFPKKMMRVETKLQKAKRRYVIVSEQLDKAKEDELDVLGDKRDTIQDEMEELTSSIYDLFRGFVLKGLIAAGYETKDAERYAEFFDYSQFSDLLQKARLGAGRVDFF